MIVDLKTIAAPRICCCTTKVAKIKFHLYNFTAQLIQVKVDAKTFNLVTDYLDLFSLFYVRFNVLHSYVRLNIKV